MPKPEPQEYRPGRLMRGLMALTDAGERAVRRGPTPFAPEPETVPDPRPLHEQVLAVLDAAEPTPSPEPIPAPHPPTLRGPMRRPEPGSKLMITIAKSGAAVLVQNGELYDAAQDGPALTEAVRAWYDGA